jgi:hypothetical protein
MAVATHEVLANQTAPQASVLVNKNLISEQTWEKLIGYIVKDNDLDRSLAERILDQALGFLMVVSLNPGRTFCPSKMVDIGWHAFLMHTRDYIAFCNKVNGQYIHHEPTAVEIVVPQTGGVIETVRAMKANSIVVDEELWTSRGDCDGDGGCDANGCCGGDGC